MTMLSRLKLGNGFSVQYKFKKWNIQSPSVDMFSTMLEGETHMCLLCASMYDYMM